MHSSTSSSEIAAGRWRWRTICLVAVALAAALVGAAEAGLRLAGFRPSVNDDYDLWALQRARAAGAAPRDTLAILGTSRAQLGLASEAFASELPQLRRVRLDVNASHPLAVLGDLGADPDFTGIVLCEVLEASFLPSKRDTQQPWVDFYHREWTLYRHVTRELRTRLETRLVVRNTTLRWRDLVPQWLRGRSGLAVNYLVTLPDRSRRADYSMVDTARRKARRMAAGREVRFGADHASWLAEVARQREPVQRIQARGGRVVFLRMPVGAERALEEERLLPKAEYWDRIAGATGAVTIHFRDSVAMARFDSPDASHLDQRDAPAYTRELIAELIRRGVVPQR